MSRRTKSGIERSCLGYEKAVALLRRGDTRMMLMHVPWGKAYFIVPGGMISKHVAEAIMRRDDVKAKEDGLFPGHSQTWVLGFDK